MKRYDMSHDGTKHVEWRLGKFFIAYNGFVRKDWPRIAFPPRTAGVHIFRFGKLEFGWW